MRDLLKPFELVVTAILTVAYVYVAWRLTSHPGQDVALAIPFILVWVVPVLYWGGKRSGQSTIDKLVRMTFGRKSEWVCQ